MRNYCCPSCGCEFQALSALPRAYAAAIQKEYARGDSLQAIADRHGSSVPTVYKNLQKLGVTLRRRGRPAGICVKYLPELLRLKAEGVTPTEIGKRLSISQQRVSQILQKAAAAARTKAR